MLSLLTEVAIFAPLPNGCLCQIAGDALVLSKTTKLFSRYTSGPQPSKTAVKRKADHAEVAETDCPPYKRRKLADPAGLVARTRKARDSKRVPLVTTKTVVTRSLPAKLLLARVRMFYARPNLVPHTNTLVIGLPTAREYLGVT